jgi:hypothetical protein
MDDASADERRTPKAGDRVGLGRVVEDHEQASRGRAGPDDVEEASDESFPASDPPAFAPGRPEPRKDEPRKNEPRIEDPGTDEAPLTGRDTRDAP